jgi:diguanylate cyclase
VTVDASEVVGMAADPSRPVPDSGEGGRVRLALIALAGVMVVGAVLLALQGEPIAALLIPLPPVLVGVVLRSYRAEEVIAEAAPALPSREQFLVDAQSMIDGGEGQPAVLVIDLSRFRDVETVLGDDRALVVLDEVGRRIAQVAEQLPVSAFGGERFAVAMMARPFMPAHHLARQIRESISQPLVIDGVELRLASSIGMALGEGQAEGLVRRASIAVLGAAGDASGLEVHRIEPEQVVRRRLAVASALTNAMDQPDVHNFRPEFQPIVDPQGGLLGAEALARWTDPQLGRVTPDEFIPLAEQTGLVGPLFSVILERSLAACAAWQAAGLTAPVSVNVSAINLRQPLLVSEITAAVERAGLGSADVTLEVTETAVVDDEASALRTLTELRAVGFRVSLDDFGVGQSSLARLRTLPVSAVKLDKSFTDGLPRDERSLAVVQATVHVCRALGLDIVAEGIETPDQAKVLSAMGITKLQGYLFSRSIPVDELIATQHNPVAGAR